MAPDVGIKDHSPVSKMGLWLSLAKQKKYATIVLTHLDQVHEVYSND